MHAQSRSTNTMLEGTTKLILHVSKKLEDWGFSPSKSRLLLATSGGRDSMLLWKVLGQLKYTFDIAHVNYDLRGEESNGDAQFVEEAAKLEGRTFHLLEASEMMKSQSGNNVQSAAREIRYTWFESLKEQFGFEAVLTAHHQEDQAETFLLQLLRGSGGKGLSGMEEQNDLICRPLLEISSAFMEDAANDLKVTWREDSSNESIKYRRNHIRKLIMPELKQLNPEASQVLAETCTRLKTEQNLLNYFIQHAGILEQKADNSSLLINKQKLQEHPEPIYILHHLLADFGFSWSLCAQIGANLTKTEELVYHTALWSAASNRRYITVYQEIKDVSMTPKSENWEIYSEIITEVADYKNTTAQNEVYLSAEILGQKLSIRNAQTGDYFYPLGMLGRKKMSDYFKDQKLSSEAKKMQLLLCVENEIAWVVNRRIDKRFAVKDGDKSMLRVKLVLAT